VEAESDVRVVVVEEEEEEEEREVQMKCAAQTE
jgi:hypothetical protein